jgi:hypothetical protein
VLVGGPGEADQGGDGVGVGADQDPAPRRMASAAWSGVVRARRVSKRAVTASGSSSSAKRPWRTMPVRTPPGTTQLTRTGALAACSSRRTVSVKARIAALDAQ